MKVKKSVFVLFFMIIGVANFIGFPATLSADAKNHHARSKSFPSAVHGDSLAGLKKILTKKSNDLLV